MGDYNVDLLKFDTHPLTSEFLESNLSLAVFPTINKPTRVTSNSATLIDNIFSNILDPEDLISCILPLDISDHFPILYYVNNRISPKSSNPTPVKKKRDMSRKNIDTFNLAISGTDWSIITNMTDT
jgi:hypothetical protein